ncbi:MAG: hypothetical protein CMO63_01785 [Verrucomicrobiales bacterium]|nr:hypothetical protein [Verrucomicrobiales bacterium]
MNKLSKLFLILIMPAFVAAGGGGPNFSEHVAQIIFNNCTSCHRKGEGAPFEFTSYEDVRKRGRLIVRVTESGFMPPWHATSADYQFEGARGLRDGEIETLTRWVEGGMPEGDPKKLPQRPTFTPGWKLGKPDLVVKMKEPYPVPAAGRDIYRSFVIPLNLKEVKWVKAVEFKPGAPEVVHHSLFRYDTSGLARRLDARSPTPGFRGMGDGNALGPRSLGGWAVGGSARFLPEGLAYRLPAGSDLILDMHFHLSGKPEKEVSTVGIYFSDKPPTDVFTAIQMPPQFGALSRVDIPAGVKDYTVEDSFVLPVDLEAFSVSAHAHYLGKQMRMTATLPNGVKKELIHIPDWDFTWQEEYNYSEFVSLPKGTRLDTTIVWDNSEDNPSNPHNPPRRVRWGLQSTDEMGSLTLAVKPKNLSDMRSLHTALGRHARNHYNARRNRPAQAGGGLWAAVVAGVMRGDKNGDGKINKVEAPRWLLKSFDKVDADSSGDLDRRELERARDRLGKGRD